jgi:hypothetical protein
VPDEPVPMLNKPKERTCETAEKFAENVLGRMNRTHEQFAELNQKLYEPTKAEKERIEKFTEEAIALIEAMTGKTFDRNTGQRIYSESEQAARWEAEANASKRDMYPTRRKR